MLERFLKYNICTGREWKKREKKQFLSNTTHAVTIILRWSYWKKNTYAEERKTAIITTSFYFMFSSTDKSRYPAVTPPSLPHTCYPFYSTQIFVICLLSTEPFLYVCKTSCWGYCEHQQYHGWILFFTHWKLFAGLRNLVC